jgi:deazaflavin-dependent oxidoreductase (nitroreductase family)
MGLLTPIAVRVGRLSFLPRYLPQIVWTDQRIERLSRGRLTLLDIAGLPNLRLTVRGRKTGQWRTVPLLAVPRGQDWLVAGSNWGAPKQPVWVVNLEANPDCRITVKGRTQDMLSRRLEGAEREAAWQHMLRTWPNYAKYAERTDRQIKVFELTPR